MTQFVLRDRLGQYWRDPLRVFAEGGVPCFWTPTLEDAHQFPDMTSANLAIVESNLKYVDVIPVDDEAESVPKEHVDGTR